MEKERIVDVKLVLEDVEVKVSKGIMIFFF